MLSDIKAGMHTGRNQNKPRRISAPKVVLSKTLSHSPFHVSAIKICSWQTLGVHHQNEWKETSCVDQICSANSRGAQDSTPRPPTRNFRAAPDPFSTIRVVCSDITNDQLGISGETGSVAQISCFIEHTVLPPGEWWF